LVRPAYVRDSNGRRGVESVLATVMIVTVTLVASIAVAGFIYGTLDQSQNASLVAITGTFLKGADFQAGGTTTAFSCAGSAGGSWISLSNSGTAGSFVRGVTITWAGGGSTFTPTGSCAVGPAGSPAATVFLVFPTTMKLGADAMAGQTFTGSVSLSNGAQVQFAGSWQ